MAELDGPGLEPKSGGQARQLVVFLHGYGADGNDLIDIGRAWQNLLPEAAFLSPHAPEPCGQAPMGRQWFPLTFRDPHERWTGVNAAAPGLDRFLDRELARRNLPGSALALVGFSQGTMMSLHVGLRRAVPPFAIVGYSGLFVLAHDAASDSVAADVRSKPPVLLIHGDQDDLIPAQALFHAANGLAALDIPAEWHLSMGIGHGIDQEGCGTAANSSPAGPARCGDSGVAHYPWPRLHNGVMDLVDYGREAVVRAARRQKEAHP